MPTDNKQKMDYLVAAVLVGIAGQVVSVIVCVCQGNYAGAIVLGISTFVMGMFARIIIKIARHEANKKD